MREKALLLGLGLVLVLTATVWGASSYVGIDLSSGYVVSSGYGASGTQQVGRGGTSGSISHALLWSGTAGNAVDLNPSGFTTSYANGDYGTQQVGYGQIDGDSNYHALLWGGTAGSYVDLNPVGFRSSEALGIRGTQQVGYGQRSTDSYPHALLWSGTASSYVDLNPSGFTASYGHGTNGSQQIGSGWGTATGNQYHALLWSGTAAGYVDLNPTTYGYASSEGYGISGSQQVGWGQSTALNQDHAMLWNGTAASYVDLNPSGFTFSVAAGTNGTQQVGYGNTGTDANSHALLWSGTAAGYVDLNPTGYVRSYARAIDAHGDVIGEVETSALMPHAYLWEFIDPATTSMTSPLSTTIVKGGTGTLGVTVGNSSTGDANWLNYSLAAAVTGGSAALGTVTPHSGSVAPGATQASTVTASSTNIGVNTIQFTANDPNACNGPQTASATLTVLDHSLASFDPNTTVTSKTIDFGGILKNASAGTMAFTIGNQAAAYRVGLDLGSIDSNGAAALTTNLSTFSNLAPGSAKGYAASLTTGTAGTFSKTVTIHLADTNLYPGADASQTLTLILQAVVGNATADRSNLMTSFGPALAGVTGLGSSYAGLQSTVTGTSVGLGAPMVGSTATILAGTNSTGSDTSVAMAWRTRTLAEAYPTETYPPTPGTSSGLVSDVVRLTGMANDGTSQSDPFVLRMNYDPSLLVLGQGMSEQVLGQQGLIYLAWLNGSTGSWENAVGGNFGGTARFCGIGDWSDYGQPGLADDLGRWGVDTADHTVWAVVDNGGQFAVVPEPATLTLLTLGALGLLRRKSVQCRA